MTSFHSKHQRPWCLLNTAYILLTRSRDLQLSLSPFVFVKRYIINLESYSKIENILSLRDARAQFILIK